MSNNINIERNPEGIRDTLDGRSAATTTMTGVGERFWLLKRGDKAALAGKLPAAKIARCIGLCRRGDNTEAVIGHPGGYYAWITLA